MYIVEGSSVNATECIINATQNLMHIFGYTTRLTAATKYFRCPKGNKLVAVGKLEERHPRRTTITVPTLKASWYSSQLQTATPSGSEYIPYFPWVSPTAINFLPFRQKK